MRALRLRHLRFIVPTCLTFAVTLGWLAEGPAARADVLPRYKLKVGQELVYRTTDPPEVKGTGGNQYSNHTVYEWIFNVAGQDHDGSLWLVFRQKITNVVSQNGKDRKQELQTDGQFRLQADGRLVENSSIRPMSNPTLLFPLLPSDAAGLERGWEDALTLDETHRRYHVSADASVERTDTWRFVEEPSTIFDPVYEMKTVRDYEFDRQAGLVRKVVTTVAYGWPESMKGTPSVQTIVLAEVRELDTSDLGAIAEQARSYFVAVETYEQTTEQARVDFARTAARFAEAEKVLETVSGELTIPWLKATLDGRLVQHKRDAQFAAQDALKYLTIINWPSADWQTTDLDDHPRSLADYRGQVVVLDFWYRACGWCVRAMPQVKQLTEEFAGKPVAILGINNDQNVDDARLIVDKFQLNYPTLKNGEGRSGISAKYKINGWPTLVVIDKKGVVRHIHFGYSATLRKEIGDKVRELLAEPAGG